MLEFSGIFNVNLNLVEDQLAIFQDCLFKQLHNFHIVVVLPQFPCLRRFLAC